VLSRIKDPGTRTFIYAIDLGGPLDLRRRNACIGEGNTGQELAARGLVAALVHRRDPARASEVLNRWVPERVGAAPLREGSESCRPLRSTVGRLPPWSSSS